MRVAIVTCERLPDLFEDDLLLVAALRALGVEPVPAVWSDPAVDWTAYDALVIRSPWDYFMRLGEFRAWLDARIASGVRMCNDGAILAWNLDKGYLDQLAAAGALLVPSIVVPRGGRADVTALAGARGWDDVVVKPTISAGAYRTHRFRIADAASHADELAQILVDRGLLIQPFLPEIERDGELSLLFFDGEYSHAVRKRPKQGDYRVQLQYGGTIEPVAATPEWIEGARACIAAAPALPVYARVDGVIHDGRFLLMELEAFEPLLYLAHGDGAPERLARAIRSRLVNQG